MPTSVHMRSETSIVLKSLQSIAEVPAGKWDALEGPADNPFVRHAFLLAMEQSGSVRPETGWGPQHLTLWEGETLLGAAPLYLKGHSYGEYVFDWGWADALERAGRPYYPKLLSASPYSPVPGPRLLTMPGPEAPGLRRLLAKGLIALAEEAGVSSLHVNFCTAEDQAALVAAGALARSGHQYHWTNQSYGSFDDFLGVLTSRKRKAIRKERKSVAQSGLVIRRRFADDLTAGDWDRFYLFYRATVDKKWGGAYLTRAFFRQIGETLPQTVLLVTAEAGGEIVAGALNLEGRDCLYGRNWGAVVELPFLHFELCYYQAIDHAIERGLARVEAGAQGQHKIQRGYLPVETLSAHWLRDADLGDAIADFLDRESRAEAFERAALMKESPYRKGEAA